MIYACAEKVVQLLFRSLFNSFSYYHKRLLLVLTKMCITAQLSITKKSVGTAIFELPGYL